MSNLQLRLISAAPLLLFALLVGWLGGFIFAAAIFIAAYFAQKEWLTISLVEFSNSLFYFMTAALALEVVLYAAGYQMWAVIVVLIFVGVCVCIGFTNSVFHWLAAGHLYSSVFALGLIHLREAPQIGIASVLFVVLIVWSTDIFAYFTGRTVGGPKLWPSISPGKTWSGAVGGFTAALIAAAVFSFFQSQQFLGHFLIIAGGLSISSQCGDLFESWFKRRFDVKDSGNIIPGHGGVLDRIDGLTFALASMLFLSLLAENRFFSLFLSQ